MVEFVTRDQWNAIQNDLRPKRSPVTAVVSFVGKDAEALMPLRRGDRLVCNADDATVRRGLTNPDALKRFHQKGVEIYSVVGLHAKVIAGKDFAWVGSANASASGYLEATVRLGASAAKPIRRWADTLCREHRQLTGMDITQLQKLPRPARVWAPRPPRAEVDLSQVERLRILWLDDWADEEQIETGETEREQLLASHARQSGVSRWNWFGWSTSVDGLDEGSWVVIAGPGRPSRPARIERSSLYPRFRIIWYREASTPRRATQSELADAVPKWWDWDGSSALLVNRRSTVDRVLDLYR